MLQNEETGLTCQGALEEPDNYILRRLPRFKQSDAGALLVRGVASDQCQVAHEGCGCNEDVHFRSRVGDVQRG